MNFYVDIAPLSHSIVQFGAQEIISKTREPDFVSFQEDNSTWFVLIKTISSWFIAEPP